MDRPVGRKRRRKTETPSSDTRVPITIPDPSDHDRPIWVITIAEMRMAAFFAWLKEELTLHALLPSNPFTKAAHYALERKAGLEVFLTDPDVPLDTNHLDRALRPIPMGRKNWLFCWTELGAERVGQIQSLLGTLARFRFWVRGSAKRGSIRRARKARGCPWVAGLVARRCAFDGSITGPTSRDQDVGSFLRFLVDRSTDTAILAYIELQRGAGLIVGTLRGHGSRTARILADIPTDREVADGEHRHQESAYQEVQRRVARLEGSSLMIHSPQGCLRYHSPTPARSQDRKTDAETRRTRGFGLLRGVSCPAHTRVPPSWMRAMSTPYEEVEGE